MNEVRFRRHASRNFNPHPTLVCEKPAHSGDGVHPDVPMLLMCSFLTHTPIISCMLNEMQRLKYTYTNVCISIIMNLNVHT